MLERDDKGDDETSSSLVTPEQKIVWLNRVQLEKLKHV